MATIYQLKPRFQRALAPLQDRLVGHGVSANQLTAAGLAVSVMVGAAFAAAGTRPGLLWAVPGLLFIRMALNALDGLVARQTGTATRQGRILNEMADVSGDVVAYLPLGLVLPGHAVWVAAVVCGGLLAEIASILGGEPRNNHGPLGKSDRAFAFGLLAVVLAAVSGRGTWITIALASLSLLAAATVVNRVRHA
jgi:CDP-diacylglycerol--glycerol-3-phosphate 3-phosphatidyltransferase